MLNDVRLYPRVTLQGRATIVLTSESLPLRINNLSENGVQGECDRATFQALYALRHDDGSWPTLRLRFEEARDAEELEGLELTCRMIYQRRLSRDAYFIGMAFEEDEANLREPISRTVSRRLASRS